MLGLILQILPTLSVMGIVFTCGWALRNWQLRRRRAVEREKFYPRHPELRDSARAAARFSVLAADRRRVSPHS